MKKRFEFLLQNWKLGIHLLFRTKRFGVNNKRWSEFDSMFGVSKIHIFIDVICIKPIIRNWFSMKSRAKRAYFINDEQYKLIFGEERYPKIERNRNDY